MRVFFSQPNVVQTTESEKEKMDAIKENESAIANQIAEKVFSLLEGGVAKVKGVSVHHYPSFSRTDYQTTIVYPNGATLKLDLQEPVTEITPGESL